MNAFKAVFLLCAVLGAASATQYANKVTGGFASQSSPAGQGGAYGQKGVQQQQAAQPSWATTANEGPVSSASYGMFSSAPAGNNQASAMPTPGVDAGVDGAASAGVSTTVRQVCTCVTLPAAPQIPANVLNSFGSFSAAAPVAGVAAPVAQQNAFASPATQIAQQNTYSAPQQQAAPQATSVSTGNAY